MPQVPTTAVLVAGAAHLDGIVGRHAVDADRVAQSHHEQRRLASARQL
eukprot:CAMPEP_0118952580 /NCGR_PEP_ID=MMETSP1169-20130426/55121_1 /TAXON_ID=36882 /ORGANISM="Pyramimonas obovata, Strain CCMP722" /LENGTH=47 /DNA_ID= /DNA_START= /DNA_END= /DNA_ORIENTATION=